MRRPDLSDAGVMRREPPWGRVLLEADDDLTAGTTWSEQGYTVARFLSGRECRALRQGIEELVVGMLRRRGLAVPEEFIPERYHHVVGTRDDLHEEVVRRLGKCRLSQLPIEARRISDRIGEICGMPLTTKNPYYGLLGDVASRFGVRVVRPRSNDHNPLHRDVWLNRLRHAINIYVPVAGSDAGSSLPVVPGSHRWPEADVARSPGGAKVNGRTYTVPAVTSSKRRLASVRPNPGEHDVLVFSPYLLHGGATNLNPDATRVSLEMRFWRSGPGAFGNSRSVWRFRRGECMEPHA